MSLARLIVRLPPRGSGVAVGGGSVGVGAGVLVGERSPIGQLQPAMRPRLKSASSRLIQKRLRIGRKLIVGIIVHLRRGLEHSSFEMIQ